MILDKGTKIIQLGMDSLFNKWCCKNDSHMQRMKLDPYLTLYTKGNSKITILNVKPRTAMLRRKHRAKGSQPWIWQ